MSNRLSPSLRPPHKPIELQISKGVYGHKNQNRLDRLAFSARSVSAEESSEWLHITAHISDCYVDSHPGRSFDQISAAYRRKVFEALRRAGIRYSAYTVAGIAPAAKNGPRCVNPIYGLHLHLAIKVSPDDQARLQAVLMRQCHTTHEEAEVHSAAGHFRPTLAKMQIKRKNGTAVFFEFCNLSRGGLHGLIGYFARNTRAYLKHAIQRGLDLGRIGKGLIHLTRDLREAGRNLYQQEHKNLRQKLKAAPKRGRPPKHKTAASLLPAAATATNDHIDAEAPTKPVEAILLKSSVIERDETNGALQVSAWQETMLLDRIKQANSLTEKIACLPDASTLPEGPAILIMARLIENGFPELQEDCKG